MRCAGREMLRQSPRKTDQLHDDASGGKRSRLNRPMCTCHREVFLGVLRGVCVEVSVPLRSST